MEYLWKQTSPVVYRAIYEQHREDLVGFESYTEMDDHGEKLRAQITAWGFKGAKHPLIRSELRDYYTWTYSILEKAWEEE